MYQPLEPGTVVGKYSILSRLALGGMAELYLARAGGIQGFEKLVVLKLMLAHLAEDDQMASMFRDEARVAATLRHANIAQVYDIGMVGERYFLTMEFVHGVDLRAIMHRVTRAGGGMPLGHSIAILLGVTAGLHHAHEACGLDGRPLNLVHRDVSPSNVLVGFDGAVKVVDFGIAKVACAEHHTRAGQVKGKFGYMSPEQCRGLPIDRRSDVFACGILLYEATTGTRLFFGDTEFDVMRRVITCQIAPPSMCVSRYPAGLEVIVMRALRRLPEERYNTAEELYLDIEAFAREEKLVVSPVSLGRYMREMFPERVAAWREKTGESVQTILQTTPSRPTSGPPPTSSSSAHPLALAALDGPTEIDNNAATVTEPSPPPAMVATSAATMPLGIGTPRSQRSGSIPYGEATPIDVEPPVPTRRRWPRLLVVVGAAGVAAAAALFLLASSRERRAVPVPVSDPSAVRRPVEPAPLTPLRPVAPVTSEPVATPIAPVEATPVGAAPAASAPAADGGKLEDGAKRKGKKTRKKTTAARKPSTKKPGWDPDSPFEP